MELPANIRPRVIVNKTTHIKRGLLGKGKLNIQKGVEVTPDDVLGTFEVSAGFFSVSLARELGVASKEAPKYLQRPIGSKIYKGELLAFKKSIFGQKVITAPTDGVLQAYDENRGELQLRFLPKATPLTSGVFGIVDDINEATGEVLIRTIVTEVMGILGSGKERGGMMNVLGNSTSLLSSNQVSPLYQGQILVTGALILGDSLRRCAEVGVYGVVTGGINAEDFKAMTGSLNPAKRIGNDAGISVLATEGYGSMPIGEDIYSVIKPHHGKFALISGNAGSLMLPSNAPDCIIKLRKTIIPILKQPESSLNIGTREISVGSKVRIIWPPFAGLQGKVIGIDQSATKLPSGVSTYLLTVASSNQKIKVPYLNIELIV